MKRSFNVVKHELYFLQSLVDERIVEMDRISTAVEKGLDRLANEQNLSREELIQIVLINFKYSILEAIKGTELTFDFKKLTLKEICYFYFMHRLSNSARYLA